MRWAAICGAVLVLAGCASDPLRPRGTDAASQALEPQSMRIHPIFSGVKDWNGDGKPDGIEALIELQDGFGDPTKATGVVLFELFEFRRAQPDPRGQRLVNPWIGSIQTLSEQKRHWNRTSRTYGFQLAWDAIRADRPYVLTASFTRSIGGRFFDRIILEPAAKESSRVQPTTLPDLPGSRPAQP